MLHLVHLPSGFLLVYVPKRRDYNNLSTAFQQKDLCSICIFFDILKWIRNLEISIGNEEIVWRTRRPVGTKETTLDCSDSLKYFLMKHRPKSSLNPYCGQLVTYVHIVQVFAFNLQDTTTCLIAVSTSGDIFSLTTGTKKA